MIKTCSKPMLFSFRASACVFPGKRMAGQLGNVSRTAPMLEVARIDTERQLILVKGAVPGHKNGTIVVRPAAKTKLVKGGAK